MRSFCDMKDRGATGHRPTVGGSPGPRVSRLSSVWCGSCARAEREPVRVGIRARAATRAFIVQRKWKGVPFLSGPAHSPFTPASPDARFEAQAWPVPAELRVAKRRAANESRSLRPDFSDERIPEAFRWWLRGATWLVSRFSAS